LRKLCLMLFFILLSFSLFFAESTRYTLQVGDSIEIFNYSYADLTQSAEIGPDGLLEARLIGTIYAVGKTPEQLASELEKEYKKYASESRITVIVKSRKPQIVYAMGELKTPQNIDMLMNQNLTLLEIVSLCGGPTEGADLSSVMLLRDNTTRNIDISSAFNEGKVEENIVLQPGDMIIVPKKYERRVYIFGDSEKSGAVYFEEKEPMTLNYLLSKLSYDSEIMQSEIQIHRNGQKLSFDALFTFNNQEQILLETNDIIVFRKAESRFCYVTGREESGRIEFAQDEQMTLRILMGKLGVDMTYLPDIEILHTDGSKDSFDSERLNTFDFNLSTGDIVQFPISKYLYLIGNAPTKGRITFSTHEELTLLTLLIKVGYQIEEPVDITIIDPDGKKEILSTKNLLQRDIFLVSGSIIQFPEERYVNLVGDITNSVNSNEANSTETPDRLTFRYDEAMTLKTVIQRLNAIPVESGISVTVLRGLEQYEYNTREVFYSDNEIALQIGDTLVFEKDRNRYVMLLKEGNKLSKIYFNANEEMDIFQLFMKLGTISETWNDEVRIFLPNGDVQVTDVDAVLSRKSNFPLEPKSMVVIPETFRSVYVFGNCKTQGEILFKRDESFDMRNLIIKVGADLTEGMEKIIVKNSSGIEEYDPENFLEFENNVSLQPDAIVYFQAYTPIKVSVFGRVSSPGIKEFAKDEPANLMMLLAKCEGFESDANRNIRIIDSDGKTTVINYDELTDPAGVRIKDGAYIIVDENINQYATVIGDVNDPGIQYMRKNSMTLLEMLNAAGSVISWEINTHIEITRSTGEKEVIHTEMNPITLNGIQIYAGDIVYVMPSSRLKVYVLGEVNSQLILKYYEGLTLFEAVMRAGGATDSAYLKKILYYKGGINSYPQVVDLSNIKWSQPTEAIYLEPGDVIYVPRSAMVDILRVTGFIGSMITFSTDAVDVYNGLTGSSVQVPVVSDTTTGDN